MGWEQVIYLIIVTLISVALAPKPPKPKPATLDDFDFPTADENRPVPVVFGTVRVTGPNVLWYGDLGTKKRKKGGLFGSTTIGYKYFIGIHFGVCHGPVDAVLKVDVADKQAWAGTYTANGIITIANDQLFGGPNKEGGLSGYLDVTLGDATQGANTYLNGVISPNVPAFRGITAFVWRGAGSGKGDTGGYIGTTPYAKPWAFTIKRITKGWKNDTVWYAAKVAIGNNMNPAHIVYETLTNAEWGMGVPAGSIDNASFQAAADTLYTEGFGLSLMWNQAASVEDFLKDVLNHFAAVLAFDRTTGTYRLVLLRGGYNPATLPLYDESTIGRISDFQRQLWGETVNELTLTYTDPTNLKDTSVTVHDLANIRAQGARVAEHIQYPGINSAAIAAEVAARELGARSTPLAKCKATVNRDTWATLNADLIRVSYPQLGLSEVVFRVMSIRQGTPESGEITLELLEDIYALDFATYTSQQPPDGEPTSPLDDPDDDSAGASVISTIVPAPPGVVAPGDSYLVPFGASGEWATHEGQIATYSEDFGGWVYESVPVGTLIVDESQGATVEVTPTGADLFTPLQPGEAVYLTAFISPGALTGTVNDYEPTGFSGANTVRLTANAPGATITGFGGGAAGRLLLIHNVGTQPITFTNEDTNSALGNRLSLNDDVTLNAYQSTLLQYDGTSSRWRIIGGTGSGGATTTASNLGTGAGVFAAKVINDLQFKSLKAGANVSISQTGTEITINGAPQGGIGGLEKTVGAGWTGNGGAIVLSETRPVTVYVNQPSTIIGWAIIGDAAGSAVVDVRKTTLAGLPAGPGDSIAASAKPTLSAARYATDTTLTGWTVQVNAGDVLTFQLESTSGLEQVTVYLQLQVLGGVTGSKMVGAAFVGEPLTTDANEVVIYFERAAYINSATIIGDTAGSAVIDVRKVALASLPAGVGNSICSATPPSLIAQRSARDTTLASWDRDIAAGDTLTFVLTSTTGLNTATLQLDVTEHL